MVMNQMAVSDMLGLCRGTDTFHSATCQSFCITVTASNPG